MLSSVLLALSLTFLIGWQGPLPAAHAAPGSADIGRAATEHDVPASDRPTTTDTLLPAVVVASIPFTVTDDTGVGSAPICDFRPDFARPPRVELASYVYDSRANTADLAEPFGRLRRALSASSEGCVAPRAADDLVDLASPARRTHILDGEVRPNGTFGGGHRAGTGFPGKTEFPASWSDDLIMHHVSDVVTDPASRIVRQQGRDVFVRGVRDGREIEVLLRNGEIWTAYPVRP